MNWIAAYLLIVSNLLTNLYDPMAANVLHNHNQNPYYKGKNRQHIVIFSGVKYYVNIFIVISPIALRVMPTLASKLNEEGYAAATLDELARYIRTPRTYVNKGILDLARYNLIKKKRRGEYWIIYCTPSSVPKSQITRLLVN